MEQVMNTLREWGALYGPRVVGAIAILILGRLVARGLRSLIRKALRKQKVDETLVSFTSSVSYAALMAFIIIAALSQLGIQTASFVAVLGATGLAVGLALQGSLANFAAGVLMMLFKPFKVGDFIEGGGTSGVVEDISIFTTKLRTPDNKKVIIPNGKLTSDNVTNFTAADMRRVDIVAGVDHSEDLDRVKSVIADEMNRDDRILRDPPPMLGVVEIADSSVNIAVRPWVKTEDYWDVFFSLQERIKKRFDAEGIIIPYPQMDVHLKGKE